MSPLRFLGSLLVGKISSRRICGQAAGSARLRHLADARKLTDGKALKEERFILTDEEALKEEAMKKRFEEWMIKYRQRYKDEEEKAWRYELLKRRAQDVDEANARGSATFETNDFSDETEEVRRRSLGGSVPTVEEFEMLKLRLRDLGLHTR